MERGKIPAKDLPPHVRQSYKLFKAHGTIVFNFIRANGGGIESPRDWDYAPYLVKERLKGKQPPQKVKESLDIIIENRVLTANWHEAHRKATGKPLAPVDLSHLSFIDKFRNMQRAWFPDDVSTEASNKRRNTGVRKQQPISPLTSDWTQFALSSGTAPMGLTSQLSQNDHGQLSATNSSQLLPSSEKDQEKEPRARDTWGGINQAALVLLRLILLLGYGLIIVSSLILILIVRSLMCLKQTLAIARRLPAPSSSMSTPSEDL